MANSSGHIYINSSVTPHIGVSIADIQTVLSLTSYSDIGGLIINGDINKWAKFKPVRGTAPDIPTVEGRRAAGRTTPQDYSRQFGVHGSGAGNVVDIADIHLCSFEYERPQTGQGHFFRLMDFVNPEDTSYGYRHNAHTDLQGIVYPTTGTIVVPTSEVGMELSITYSPLTTAEAKEMISIKDFLTNESGQGTTFDPLSCYPCALITQGSYHYIRGLYKQSGSAPATIGQTGNQMWRLDCTDPPAWTAGSTATFSLFLVSQKIILHGSPNLNIDDWITIAAVDGDAAWEAWMCPIPDATGKTVTIGAVPSRVVELTGASISGKTITVDWSVTGTGLAANYTLTLSMGGDSPTKTMFIRPYTTSGSTTFDLDTDFPNTLFIPGVPQTETYMATILNEGVTPPAVADVDSYTLTYQG